MNMEFIGGYPVGWPAPGMCQGTNHQHHRDALMGIRDARKQLTDARSNLGNDHPAYGLLGHMIDDSYEAETRFPCRYDDLT